MKSAFWALLGLFVYYQVDRWTPLGDWNGNYSWPVHNDQFGLDLVVAAVLLGAIVSFRTGFKIGMLASTALLGLWAYFHIQSWWLPYYTGALNGNEVAFHSSFLNHTQILPRFENHYPPDAEHVLIDVFLLVALVRCLMATVEAFWTRKLS